MSPSVAAWSVESSRLDGSVLVLVLRSGDRTVHATARFELSEARGVECTGIAIEGEVGLDALRHLVGALPAAGIAHARHHLVEHPLGAAFAQVPRGSELDRQLKGETREVDYRLRLVALAWCEPFVTGQPQHRRKRVRRALGYGDTRREVDAGDVQADRLVKRARAAGMIPPTGASDDELTAAWSRLTRSQPTT